MKWLLTLLIALTISGCINFGSGINADVVRIDMTGKTYLNDRPISVSRLSKSFTKDSVLIRADRSTPYSKVSAVMDEVQKAGITKVEMSSLHK